ncbi:UBP-type zinc finger domain-containing protein [Rathayibacter festucae]|uniref:UBP-type zinc finger domain-containing protein n=1 Tax=Rathayibacter festucae TaxID=110937 RepID=UPI001FB4D0C9|nr:UBP-type zinc finger domain-containing protein [Rathayibacter festucae]MCJ1698311.1 UBP-type zinc finger domain-containing protein [Rathayibacter festucae]
MTTQQMIDPSVPPSGPGCVECERTASWWLHLRRCALCGHIGCGDDSLNRHATAHFHETGHSVIQSFEPGEDWFWDYRSDDYADGPRLADPQSHPEDQSTPGPADRVPRDWQAVLTERS